MTAGALLLAGALNLEMYWALIGGLAALLALPVIAPAVTSGGVLVAVVLSTVVSPAVPGSQYFSLAIVLGACAMWGMELVVRKTASFHRDRSVLAAVTLMAVALLSFVVGQYPWFPVEGAPMRAQLGGLSLLIASGGLFLATGHQLRSVAQLRRLTWLFVVLGAFFVVQQSLSSTPLEALNTITQPDMVGSLFWTWFVAITVSQAFINTQLRPVARAALLLVGVLALGRGLVIAFSWVSGWLPPLVAVIVIMVMRVPRFTLCSVAVLAAPALALSGAAMDALMQGESYSMTTRAEAVRVVVAILERNPLLGYGPANYYHYAQLFPIMGWWVRFNSHNNYLDIVAQMGIVGLAAFVWFAAGAVATAWRVRRGAADGFVRAYATSVIAGVIASMVSGLLADWVLPFTYNVGIKGFRSSLLFWLFSGGALALARMAAAQAAGASTGGARLQVVNA